MHTSYNVIYRYSPTEDDNLAQREACLLESFKRIIQEMGIYSLDRTVVKPKWNRDEDDHSHSIKVSGVRNEEIWIDLTRSRDSLGDDRYVR